jgi:hypothetical protein
VSDRHAILHRHLRAGSSGVAVEDGVFIVLTEFK